MCRTWQATTPSSCPDRAPTKTVSARRVSGCRPCCLGRGWARAAPFPGSPTSARSQQSACASGPARGSRMTSLPHRAHTATVRWRVVSADVRLDCAKAAAFLQCPAPSQRVASSLEGRARSRHRRPWRSVSQNAIDMTLTLAPVRRMSRAVLKTEHRIVESIRGWDPAHLVRAYSGSGQRRLPS